MAMLSYAQNDEDMVLWRAFGKKTDGFFVDVGAHHPTACSVTKIFADIGWRGINIEPLPNLVEIFRAERPRDINLAIGIGEHSGALPFWEVVGDPQRSTFNRELAEYYERVEKRQLVRKDVPIETLDSVLERHLPPGQAIDFIKIDAEGFEEQVLRGLDLARWRPTVVLAEHNYCERWEPILFNAGYQLTLYDSVNRFYVRSDRPELVAPLSLPPHRSMDGFEPWVYIRRIDEANQRAAHLEAQVASLNAEVARLNDTLQSWPVRWAIEGTRRVRERLHRLRARNGG
jgi:FkbM family methyltransferase